MNTLTNRIENIDALRGFALAGIVLAHFTENYVGGPIAESLDEAIHLGTPDEIADGLVFFFIRGKFFALFSFLFGLSFYLQMHRAAKKGINYGARFLWRILILFGIGYVHHLFYRGDILTVYAIVGVFLIPFYKIPVKWLFVASAIIFSGVIRLALFYSTQGNPIVYDAPMKPDSEEVLAYYKILADGSLAEVFKSNSIEGFLMKMEFQFGVFSRGYLTFGFFLLGLAIGKTELFENYKQHLKKIKKVLLFLIIPFMAFGAATGFFMKGEESFDLKSLDTNLGLIFYDLVNLTMTIAIVCIFFMAWNRKWGYKFLNSFNSYGRMALTNYILQTLIGTFVLYGWGMGYIGDIRVAYMILIAFAFIAIQVFLSDWWLKRFNYGPIEWLWRCLTHFKMFPFVK